MLNLGQKLMWQGGIPANDRGRVSSFLNSYRGSVSRDQWPTVDRIMTLVDNEGEARLEARGIPADHREGATLEIIAGGPKYKGAPWQSWGLVARWRRGSRHWILESVERKMLGGGPDIARLTTTHEQDRIAYDFQSCEAYDIRARFSGDKG